MEWVISISKLFKCESIERKKSNEMEEQSVNAKLWVAHCPAGSLSSYVITLGLSS